MSSESNIDHNITTTAKFEFKQSSVPVELKVSKPQRERIRKGILTQLSHKKFKLSECVFWDGDKQKRHPSFWINSSHQRLSHIIAANVHPSEAFRDSSRSLLGDFRPDHICDCGRKSAETSVGRKRTYRMCCKKELLHRCTKYTGNEPNSNCLNPLHMEIGAHDLNIVHRDEDQTTVKGELCG
eukprot:333424_1